jgi:hypothetical protein
MSARTAVAKRTEEKARYQRPQDWRGALVYEEHLHRKVSIKGLAGPMESPIVWQVYVTVEHISKGESAYHKPATPVPDRIAEGNQPARVTLDIGHYRGGKTPSRKYEIECELGHLDMLAETLTAALMAARRDGMIPLTRGIRPWKAEIGR